MSQGKCNLLKPVDNLTGTFFSFSQYAQDLTKQYTQSDYYRCVPSKYAAFNLDLSYIASKSTEAERAKVLGEIFENYFENSCAFLRSQYNNTWDPEYTRTLLFQTLEKFGLISASSNIKKDKDGNTISASSTQLQYIGDINIYSYNDNEDGIGYNEIYCYIPNDAKCYDYEMSAVTTQDYKDYGSLNDIVGYEGKTPYNNLSWTVNGTDYIDTADSKNCYAIGKYGAGLTNLSLVPNYLETSGGVTERTSVSDSFDINSIVVFYDIVKKSETEDDVVLHKNIPLGIYFTGKPNSTTPVELSNIIHKFIKSDTIYNQGTSYGLRVCSRFLFTPNSTEIIENQSVGSTNISELSPLFDEMYATIESFEKILAEKNIFSNDIKSHLSSFKNNKANVPYTRILGDKKYWFVNGKNTGAVAEWPESDSSAIKKYVDDKVSALETKIYTDLSGYVKKSDLQTNYYTKTEIDAKFTDLENRLKVWLQSE